MSSSGAVCEDAAEHCRRRPFARRATRWWPSVTGMITREVHRSLRESGMGEGEERKGTVYFEVPGSMNVKINTFIKIFQYKDAMHSHAESQLVACARLAFPE